MTVDRIRQAVAPIPLVTSLAGMQAGVAYLSPLADSPTLAAGDCWQWVRTLTIVGQGLDVERAADWISARMIPTLRALIRSGCSIITAETEIADIDGLDGPTALFRITFREDAA